MSPQQDDEHKRAMDNAAASSARARARARTRVRSAARTELAGRVARTCACRRRSRRGSPGSARSPKGACATTNLVAARTAETCPAFSSPLFPSIPSTHSPCTPLLLSSRFA
eukprot:3486899-Pleurochrysis_carterae.AAC.2